MAITDNHKFGSNPESCGWPTDIDFVRLHQRIMDLDKNGEIKALLANGTDLHEAVAWRSFINKIAGTKQGTSTSGRTLLKWSNMVALKKFEVVGGNFGG